jgi:hypothetical protein
MVGLAAGGLMVFGSLRMGPKLLTQRFGGQQRRLAMEEAEEQAKNRGTEEIQKVSRRYNCESIIFACLSPLTAY